MINLLAKLFIKNYKNYSDSKVRLAYGVLCAILGIILNLFLFASKFIAGTLAKSVAITADAFNNLSDSASSIIQLLGFKLASKEPDKNHPFGHGRLEYISGLLISFLILLMGFELLKSSVISIFHPEELSAGTFSIAVMAFSIAIKCFMFFYNHSMAKKLNSVSLEAVAKDSLTDCISTFAVIIAAIVSRFVNLPLDGIAGTVVALFIIKTGWESASDTIAPLLGKAPTKEFVMQIQNEVLKHQPICGMHDLIVHDYGPGRLLLSLHAEVPGDRDIFELHEIIDETEQALSKKFKCLAVIHMDPIDTKNERLNSIKLFMLNELPKIDGDLKFHDVRLVPGKKHTNLIFDLVKPYNCPFTDKTLKTRVNRLIKDNYSDVNCVITIDSPFVQ